MGVDITLVKIGSSPALQEPSQGTFPHMDRRVLTNAFEGRPTCGLMMPRSYFDCVGTFKTSSIVGNAVYGVYGHIENTFNAVVMSHMEVRPMDYPGIGK